MFIHLSEPGRDTLGRVDEAVIGHAESLLTELGAAERTDLMRLLERLTSTTADRPAEG